MNKNLNHGIYADWIKQYLTYKRSMGFKMKDVEYMLGKFNRLAITRSEVSIGISKELFDEWSKPAPGESATHRYYKIGLLRQFSSYLRFNGYDSYIPKLPKFISTHTPHIYTKVEIASLFKASDKLFQKNNNMDGQICILPSLLRLLYGTGLRLGEALALKNKDVRLDKEYLFVKSASAKNGQDRIVPISSSLIEVCKDFMAYKQQQLIDCSADKYFFTALNGNKCGCTTAYAHFRTALYKAGIPHQGRGKGPRLHDLRHTFCVNALVKMSEAGMDLYYSLPVLSTYVGHQSIEATNKYVRLTAEMYPDLLQKVNNAYKYLFPEIGTDEERF